MKETVNGYIRREQIMKFLQKYIKEHGYSPSHREIGDYVGLTSSSSIKNQLDILKSLGRITYTPGVARTIKVLRK